MKKMIDIKKCVKLAKNTTSYLKSLREILIKNRFTVNELKKYTGKEVVRYTSLFSNDQEFLQNQVFYGNENLLTIVELFLLNKQVPSKKILKLFDKHLIKNLIKIGILQNINNKDKIYRSSVCLTPVSKNFYFNEGEIYAKYNFSKSKIINPKTSDPLNVYFIAMEQPYLLSVFSLIESLNPNIKCEKILDICCGSGVLGLSLGNSESQIYGVDLNPRATFFSELNSIFNSKKGKFINSNATKIWPKKEKFDLIVSNPPFNGFVDLDKKTSKRARLPLHAGNFGDALTRPILNNISNFLSEKGIFCIISSWLLKNNLPAYEMIKFMMENGTVILFHKPIVKADTWEGLRQLYWAENISKFKAGYLKNLIKNSDFDSVTWGVLCWLKNKGPRGFHLIENTATDRQLISASAKSKFNAIFKKKLY